MQLPGRLRSARTSRSALLGMLVFAATVGLLPQQALAYGMDTHYYLRFALSLSTCFEWDEAHLIASGDNGMDENGTVSAEMNPVGTRNKIDWHAFGHSDQRYRQLWLRAAEEPDLEARLIKLGQFMHFAEDWESHAGYGIRMGHARDTYAGRDPDSLGRNPAKNHRMIQSSVDHLLTTCADLGRIEGDRDQHLIRIMSQIYETGLLDDLHANSRPGWKKGKLGCRNECLEIRADNKERIEQFLVDLAEASGGIDLPVGFAAGPEPGIPESLMIPFDSDGAVVTVVSMRESIQAWAAAAETSPDIALELMDAAVDFRPGASGPARGWRVTVVASNVGELESESGQVEVIVIDSDDENVLAQTSVALPGLEPGESIELQASLPVQGQVAPDAIISAFARVGDLSAENDADWLMLGDAEFDDADEPDVTDLDPLPEGPEVVSLIGAPKTFVMNNQACVLVTALASGGDSPEKLEPVAMQIVGGETEVYYFYPRTVGRWSAFSTEDGLVAGKTFECYESGLITYQLLAAEDPDSLRLAVAVGIDDAEAVIEEFPLEREFLDALIELARQAVEGEA